MRTSLLAATFFVVGALTVTVASATASDPRTCAGMSTRAACANLAAVTQLRAAMSRRAGLPGTSWDSDITCVPQRPSLLAFRCSWRGPVSKGTATVQWQPATFRASVTAISNVCARSLTDPTVVPKGCTSMTPQ